jgi:hypothetical protein
MMIAFLGDVLFAETLTHTDFRWCVFDLNDDVDTILESVKKCRIDKLVYLRARTVGLRPQVSGNTDEVLLALKRMARWVRRPTILSVIRYFHENSITSFFIIGLLLTIAINPIADFLKQWGWLALAFAVVFVLLVIKEVYWPSGKLR